MVQLVGLNPHEEILVTGLIAQFSSDEFLMGELRRVEKRPLAGYNGLVEPTVCHRSDRFDMTMLLASTNPFTLAHELAHVSDISTRRRESRDHLSLAMPNGWHLAHRMSSEYYANRIACRYADEADIFLAFKSDHAGFRQAIADSDWAGVLIYYALLLGIMHGMGQLDCDPLRLIAAPQDLPRAVLDGIEAFRHQSVGFFDGYGTDTDLAEAA
ncbi:MAG TPA: hypothetical protein VL974_14425 [Magnetospirillum sp.]|jgi:hypothetical protein|nr:hypothetical protein [Magnetospirillum sp.]